MNKENYKPSPALPSSKKPSKEFKIPQRNRNERQKELISSRSDEHEGYIRLIVAENQQYFQSKVRMVPKGNSKDLKLKIPCGTGSTIYKKDYHQKQQKYTQTDGDKLHMTAGRINNNNFFKTNILDQRLNDRTIYQKDYKNNQLKGSISSRGLVKKNDLTKEEDKVPMFFETTNKNDFLNWAGKNYVPSMKPLEKSAVTNLPFQAQSSYQANFLGKTIAQTPLILQQSSFPKFGNINMMTKSSYNREFSLKKGGKSQKSFKPKNSTSTSSKFKGNTEYKSQFINTQRQRHSQDPYKCLQDLQAFIISL